MTLTEMLAVAGGVVLAGVVAHGAWSARKAGPRRADVQVEPVLDGARQEPGLDASPLGEAAVSQDAGMPAAPFVPRPPRKPSARIDALIDAIATATLDAPISGEMAISHLPGSRRAGTKPFHIEGMNAESGEWELPAPGQRYGEFQAGVQMANRNGAMNEIEYSEFVQKVQSFADGVGAFVQFPDMLDVVSRARELDHFAGDHDAQLTVILRAKSATWTLGFVQQVAARHGFVPGAMPGRLVLASEEEGAPPILTLNFESQAALAENPQLSALRELSLSLDVAQTPEALEPFASWQEAARGLARDIEADVCDDRGQVLNLHAFASIGQDLSTLYRALASRDLAAGSLVSRRLFS
ncbi:cell division protein FtsZ [Roseateles albus]|uniref:Cell division protein FtsZ n=1 Tax=Roseateles albus TaxID=2987525 RepID=A0ABT5KJA7_9BURK|nr:cell division protein FtsZ [Roseateles albus]MDC8774024.1 cell division protein FtsZ [Roseateles albus]